MTDASFSKGQPTIIFFTQHGRAPCMTVPIETPRSQALKTVANGLIYYSARDLKEAFHKRKKNLFFLDEYINGSRLNKRKNNSMVP